MLKKLVTEDEVKRMKRDGSYLRKFVRVRCVARSFSGVWEMLYWNFIKCMQKRCTFTGRVLRLLDPNIGTSGL